MTGATEDDEAEAEGEGEGEEVPSAAADEPLPPTPSPPPSACPVHGGDGDGTAANERRAAAADPSRKTSTIRQHYYPEGGWGWMVCACAFVVQVLTTGMQLSYGVLYLRVLARYGPEHVLEAGWLGGLSLAVSRFLAPFVVALCRRKSTRLTAVFGGLAMALACLFTSFARRLHQMFVSYGVVLGLGVGLVREAADLVVGQYFKRRREFVEILVQAGAGVGTALFAVFFEETIGAIGWRLGLQAVTGISFSAFVLGILYRSASLYHPQRRAILHLKNQRKKVKDKNRVDDKPPYFDFGTVKTRTLRVIMLSSAIAAFGIYNPIFYLALQCQKEGLDDGAILLLQTFMGFALTVGTVGFGLVVVRRSDQCAIARRYLCQAALCGLGIAILALGSIRGYHGYALFAWIYGIFLGGYHLSLKVYALEKMRARHFARAWGFVQWSTSLPVLFGVPVTGYMNQGQDSKSGFYVACACSFLGASCLFLMNLDGRRRRRPREPTVTFASVDGRTPPSVRGRPRDLGQSGSFATSLDVADGLACISEEERAFAEGITSCDRLEHPPPPPPFFDDDDPSMPPPPPPEVRVRSDGADALLLPPPPCRSGAITVVEEMTTSV